MMINPYEPVRDSKDIEDSLISEKVFFSFDGVIERDDYARLLPNRHFLWFLQAILLVLLAPTLCLGFIIATISLAKDGLSLESLVTLTIVIAVAIVAVITFITMGRKWRSNRYLKRFPDLLGVVRGEFSDKGLRLHDGKRQHWFGPSHLAMVDVTRVGIRVPLPGNPYRYLAFTDRLLGGFHSGQAQDFKKLWQRKAAQISQANASSVANLWGELVDAPESSVAFNGYCTVQEPFRSPETKQAALIESVSAVGMLGVAAYLATDSNYVFWGALAFAALGGISSFQAWRKYFYGTIERNWFQYGWVSETQVGLCHNEIGVIFDRAELAAVECSENAVVLTTHSQTRLHIFREQVAGDTEWERLRTLLPPFTSPTSPNTSAEPTR